MAIKYGNKACHEKTVPFEDVAGVRLDTKEIDKKYKKTIPPLRWMIRQSMLILVLKMITRLRDRN